jgi:hypothetical protein
LGDFRQDCPPEAALGVIFDLFWLAMEKKGQFAANLTVGPQENDPPQEKPQGSGGKGSSWRARLGAAAFGDSRVKGNRIIWAKGPKKSLRHIFQIIPQQ